MTKEKQKEGTLGFFLLAIGIFCFVIEVAFGKEVPEHTFIFFIFNLIFGFGALICTIVGFSFSINYLSTLFKEQFNKDKSTITDKSNHSLIQINNQVNLSNVNIIENRLIDELRELFDFKYTRKEIELTYYQSLNIYNNSTDKSQVFIVSSILHLKDSIITKEDAIKLFQYIVNKKGTII